MWIGLGALILLAYGNSIPLGLAVDAPYLLSNARVSAWTAENLRLIFSKPYWWPLHSDDLYRPLTLLSFLLNPGGADRPWILHAVNVLLHALNVWLVFRLAFRVNGAVPAAAGIAALFAVHPVGTDVVTNIAGRADLLAAAAVLGGTLLHARAVEDRAHALRWGGLLALVALAGVFAKENAVVLLPVLALYDFARAARGGGTLPAVLRETWREGRLSYAIVAGACVVMAVARSAVFADENPHWQPFVDNPLGGASFFASRATALQVFGWSTLLLLWPARLSADYSYDQIPIVGGGASAAQHAAWVLSLAALLVAGVFAWRARRTRTALFFWFFFFVGTRLPTANLLMPIGSILAERFLYLPMIGFFGAAVSLAWPHAERLLRPRVASAIGGVILLALAARTIARNPDWRDDDSIWRAAITASPGSYKPYKGLARVMVQRGRLDEAIALYEQSLAILDKRPLPAADRSSDLLLGAGEVYLLQGDRRREAGAPAEARALHEKARDVLSRAAETDRASNDRLRRLRERRGDRPDEILDVGIVRIHQQLGAACRRLGDLEGARQAFAWQRHLDPTRAAAYRELAETERLAGRPGEEAQLLLEAMILEPDDPAVWHVLPAVAAREGIRGLGREGGRLRIDPGDPALGALIARACPDLAAGMRRAGRASAAAEVESICARNLGYRSR